MYYFNFETGDSIWDHPCDEFYKNLVKDERKILLEKGKDYKQPSSDDPRLIPTNINRSPPTTLKPSSGVSTVKSTSTLSDLLNGKMTIDKKGLRNDFAMYDTRDLGNVEFEEEKELKVKDDGNYEDDYESDHSSKSKSGSEDDSSDGFKKPVDFGIDKETSMKLDKLNLLMMVGKEKEQKENLLRNSQDSAPSTSRDLPLRMDSPTRAYAKAALGVRDDELDSLRKSNDLKSSYDSKIVGQLETISEEKYRNQVQPEYQKDLKLFQQSIEREFDQKRLELLENKDMRIKQLKDEIEKDLNRISESEKKKLMSEQSDKLK